MRSPFVAIRLNDTDLHWECRTEDQRYVIAQKMYTDDAAPTTPCPTCGQPLNEYPTTLTN